MKKKVGNRLQRFFKLIYLKLFRINDAPQKIALGFGLGVFLGILPGTGPIAALTLAFICRLNRAAALLGSLLTNTWISVVAFLFSIKTGSFIMGREWQKAYEDWNLFLKDFHWNNLLKSATLEILVPVLVGYFIISVILGIVAYVVSLLVVVRIKGIKKEKM